MGAAFCAEIWAPAPLCVQALGVDDGEDGGEEAGSDFGEGGEEGGDEGEGPPAYPALQARRDSVRGWLCVLYSFAAPNRYD